MHGAGAAVVGLVFVTTARIMRTSIRRGRELLVAGAIFLLVGPLHVHTVAGGPAGGAAVAVDPSSAPGCVMLDLARMTWTFLWLSLICVGGGLGVVPGAGAAGGGSPPLGHRARVPRRLHALPADAGARHARRRSSSAIAPTAFLGALLACTAMFLPVSILTAVIARHWETLRERPWALACERALAPIGIGLMAAGVYTLARSGIQDWATGALALLAAVVLYGPLAASHRAGAGGRLRGLARRALSGHIVPPAETREFRWYLGGVASWFTSFGIQIIVFPWLVAVVLKEPAQRVGIAQMVMMAPAIVFMLLGGAVADRADCRRLLLRYHLLAALPPLVLAGVVAAGALGYPALLAYGFAMGTLGAFVMPGARLAPDARGAPRAGARHRRHLGRPVHLPDVGHRRGGLGGADRRAGPPRGPGRHPRGRALLRSRAWRRRPPPRRTATTRAGSPRCETASAR